MASPLKKGRSSTPGKTDRRGRKPTTAAGASAMLNVIATEPTTGLFELGETHWHETAFRTVTAALAKITRQSQRAARLGHGREPAGPRRAPLSRLVQFDQQANERSTDANEVYRKLDRRLVSFWLSRLMTIEVASLDPIF